VCTGALHERARLRVGGRGQSTHLVVVTRIRRCRPHCQAAHMFCWCRRRARDSVRSETRVCWQAGTARVRQQGHACDEQAALKADLCRALWGGQAVIWCRGSTRPRVYVCEDPIVAGAPTTCSLGSGSTCWPQWRCLCLVSSHSSIASHNTCRCLFIRPCTLPCNMCAWGAGAAARRQPRLLWHSIAGACRPRVAAPVAQLGARVCSWAGVRSCCK
jgi:hypothetical protein